MGIIPEKKCFREPSQLIKFIVLFICGIFTCTQVAQCFQKYLNPSTSTYSEFLLNDSIRYPCLTICRRPAYKNELFPMFGIARYASLESPFTFRHFNFSRFTLTDFFQTTTYNFHEIVGQYAYASKGYSQGSKDDLTLKVTSSFHFKRGRCFTFQPLITSNTFSVSGGYVFFLFHNNTNQQLNDYGVSTHGFQLYLHDPNEAVTYDEDERNNFLEILDLEASEDMRVKLEIQEFGRIPTKENLCVPDSNYSKSKCEELCVNEQMVRSNNCTAPFVILPEGNNLSECTSPVRIRNLIRDYISPRVRNELVANCNCPHACNFTIYKTSIINRRGIETQLAPNSMFCLYSTNLLFKMSEVLGYDLNQLLSDVGGSLGFLLGLSVISLICLFEEIFQLIFRWLFKNKAQKEQDTVEPNDSEIDIKYMSDEIKDDKLKSENKCNIEEAHEYKNLNTFITDYDIFKKKSEFDDHNINSNLKY